MGGDGHSNDEDGGLDDASGHSFDSGGRLRSARRSGQSGTTNVHAKGGIEDTDLQPSGPGAHVVTSCRASLNPPVTSICTELGFYRCNPENVSVASVVFGDLSIRGSSNKAD